MHQEQKNPEPNIMKKKITLFVFAALCAIVSCTKESGTVSGSAYPSATSSNNGYNGQTAARMSSAEGYSKSISVDTANRMIQSYLTSVGYPSADTALKSLSFDADSLRSYLANPNIVTIKFALAHRQTYIDAGNYGHNAGLNPNALTLVIVGVNEDNNYILNKYNGVYDHMAPCPSLCTGSISGLIQ